MKGIKREKYTRTGNDFIRANIMHDDVEVKDVFFCQGGGRYFMQYMTNGGFVSKPLEKEEWQIIFN